MLNDTMQITRAYMSTRPAKTQKWIRASAVFECGLKEFEWMKQAQLMMRFYRYNHEVQSNFIRIYRCLHSDDKEEVYIDAVPPVTWDKLSVQVWNAGSRRTLFMDNLKITTFDER